MKNDYLYSLQSGAKINISDGSCPERIVTVTGHTDSIYKAFKLICNKFEEVSLTQNKNPPLRKATSDLRSRGEIGHKLVLASLLLLSPLTSHGQTQFSYSATTSDGREELEGRLYFLLSNEFPFLHKPEKEKVHRMYYYRVSSKNVLSRTSSSRTSSNLQVNNGRTLPLLCIHVL